MCKLCSTEAVLYAKEVLPGVGLARATVRHGSVRPGDWGLVECNDPFLWWRGEIVPVPRTVREDVAVLSQYRPGERELEAQYWKAANSLIRMRVPPRIGYEMTLAAITQGYNPAEDGHLGAWIYDRLSEVVRSGVLPDRHEEPLTS